MKKNELSTAQRNSLAIKARHTSDLATLAEEVASNLTSGRHNRKLTDAHIEILLVRIAAGDTVRTVCEELGVSSGLVYSRSFNDEEFGMKLDSARRIGAMSMFEMMWDCANDQTEAVERSKLKVAVLDRMARTINRDLVDRIQVDARQAVQILLSDDTKTKL